ncbi:unnamed protein product [Rhizoctonia solani]|uniref:F-box domain-containing protein n=1 Tax=Rhizoctonia solani TaxID=456999 RepID=A0A8H3DQK7_9AGAM|nr:unnamed protein product [Rhizoctonia solani]
MSCTGTCDMQTAASVEPNAGTPTIDASSSSAGAGLAQATLAPPRKQARTTKYKSSKKAKDKLPSGVLNLPLELFTEIMSNLKPIDVLNLARTCKPFRSILMRRSSKYVWKRSADNLPYPLPPPPPWLNMPQYVSLVYTNNCMACGSDTIGPGHQPKDHPILQPELLIRLCAACQPNILIASDDIPKGIKPLIMIAHVNISSEEGINMNDGQYGLRAEVKKTKKQFKAKMVKFPGNNEKLRSWRKYGKLIRDIRDDQEKEKDEIRHRFQSDVEKRLAELGWKHDVCYVPKHLKGWGPLTRQPRKLTDRIWRNLYPKLETFLESARSERLTELPFRQQHAIINLWEDKENDLGTRALVIPRHATAAGLSGPAAVRLAPPPPETMDWLPVKQTLDACSTFQDINCRLLEVWEDIRPLAETWQRQVESQLANRLQEDPHFTTESHSDAAPLVISGQPVSEDLKVLLRADSIFQTKQNVVGYYPDDFLEKFRPPTFWVRPDTHVTNPPMIQDAQSFTLARGLAKALLQHMGAPNATYLSLNACRKRFVCGVCIDGGSQSVDIYDWTGLLNHYIAISLRPLDVVDDDDPLLDLLNLFHHSGVVTSRFFEPVYILSPDDARKYTQDKSKLATETPWLNYKEKHTCLHCPEYDALDLPVVLAHIRYTHYVMEPEVHQDYESYEVYMRQSLEATYEY